MAWTNRWNGKYLKTFENEADARASCEAMVACTSISQKIEWSNAVGSNGLANGGGGVPGLFYTWPDYTPANYKAYPSWQSWTYTKGCQATPCAPAPASTPAPTLPASGLTPAPTPPTSEPTPPPTLVGERYSKVGDGVCMTKERPLYASHIRKEGIMDVDKCEASCDMVEGCSAFQYSVRASLGGRIDCVLFGNTAVIFTANTVHPAGGGWVFMAGNGGSTISEVNPNSEYWCFQKTEAPKYTTPPPASASTPAPTPPASGLTLPVPLVCNWPAAPGTTADNCDFVLGLAVEWSFSDAGISAAGNAMAMEKFHELDSAALGAAMVGSDGSVDMPKLLESPSFVGILEDDSLGFESDIVEKMQASVNSFAEGTKMQQEVDMQTRFADVRDLLQKCSAMHVGGAAPAQEGGDGGGTDCRDAKTKLEEIKAACDADGQEAVDSCAEYDTAASEYVDVMLAFEIGGSESGADFYAACAAAILASVVLSALF